ncbi:MAG: hypothetical protein KF745_09040 [Phycisphaeraceae bacterium]|nr:hypothetical protein [Phycisphaeraceae bacterium]
MRHLVLFDDGSAPYPRLYAVGSFQQDGISISSSVRRLDPASNTWELPNGVDISGGSQGAAVFDDGLGGGPQLYMSGSSFSPITSADGPLGTIAKFNGVAWSGANFSGTITCLKVLDLDGPGPESPALFAGGSAGVYRLENGAWSRLIGGSTLSGSITSMAVFDEDGAGPNPPRLFVAPTSTPSGTVARWDGAAWSSIGPGFSNTSGSAVVLATIEDRDGPSLYVGCSTSSVTGIGNVCLAKWTGSAWAASAIGVPWGVPPGGITSASVSVLATIDESEAPAILAAGRFNYVDDSITGNVAVRRGDQWVALDHGIPKSIRCLTLAEDESLYAALERDLATVPLVVRLGPHGWKFLPALGNLASVLAQSWYTFPGESQPQVVVGGAFIELVMGQDFEKAIRFDGAQWLRVGAGRVNNYVWVIERLTPPGFSAPVLVAGGYFSAAGSVPLSRIGVFDGTNWLPLGAGFSSTLPYGLVRAVTMFDDGSGSPARLIAAGRFDHSGAVEVANVAAWNGASWEPMGGLPPGAEITSPLVYSLAVFDDDGPAGANPPRLYAAGDFEVPGSDARNIARWNGSQWEWPFPDFPSGKVFTLRVHDADGPAGPARPQLIVGGEFPSVGALPLAGVAAFDGTSWSALPGATPTLVGFGSGAPVVNAIVSAPPSSRGPARLMLGGSFISTGGVPARSFGVLTGCPACPADIDASGEVNPADIAVFIQLFMASLSTGTLDADFNADRVVTPVDIAAFVQAWLAALQGGC